MKIQVFPLQHFKDQRIGVQPMRFDKAFPELMKGIAGSRWTPDVRCWHIPYNKRSYAVLKNIFGEDAIVILKQKPQNKERIQRKSNIEKTEGLAYVDELIRMEEQLRLQRYSYSTIKTYKNFFKQFLGFYPDKDPIVKAVFKKSSGGL